jgi:cell division protein FtsL
MTSGPFPPAQQYPPQEPAPQGQQPFGQQPYGQQPYVQTPQQQYSSTGYPTYSVPGAPEKKSGGNTVLVILIVILALVSIGGWAMFFVKNNALNLANANITKKTSEISDLNSELDTANGKITDLNKQVKDKDSKIASLNGQITELTNSYICSGVSADSFSFYDANSVLDSLETYVDNTYGYFTSSGGTYLQNYGESALLYVNQGDYSYYFIAYFGDESKTGGNRIYDINNECFIE